MGELTTGPVFAILHSGDISIKNCRIDKESRGSNNEVTVYSFFLFEN